MKTGKLSALTVMAVLALWTAGCGTSSNIVVPDEVLDIPQDAGDQLGDQPVDDTGDEPIAPEDDGSGDSDGPGHATPTPPHAEGDGHPYAQGDKPLVSQRPDHRAVTQAPGMPHADLGSQWGHTGSLEQVAPIQLCEDCFQVEE